MWQPLPAGPPPWQVTMADVVVTRCAAEENWLQRVVPRRIAKNRARKILRSHKVSVRVPQEPTADHDANRVGAPRMWELRRAVLTHLCLPPEPQPGGSRSTLERPPDVAVVFIDSVARAKFITQFPRTLRLLRKVKRERERASVFNFLFYHGLPCCTKNWMYAALAGVFSPAKNGAYEPALRQGLPWVWSEYERSGFVTHVSNDVCFPSELQDWWRSEDSPLPVNVSDHPLLDTFCRRRPESAGGSGASSFQTRWDGVQYATKLDEGASICLGGQTLPQRCGGAQPRPCLATKPRLLAMPLPGGFRSRQLFCRIQLTFRPLASPSPPSTTSTAAARVAPPT